jgi:O-antigen/teichoic acid export membrane protein
LKLAYRDLLKHSGVYGAGQILARVVTILMIPVYTHYLRPADFACVALLDLLTGVLAILIGSGMAQAVNRFHFEAMDERQIDRVWWSGFTFVLLTATCVTVPAFLWAEQLAFVSLGGEQSQGGYFLALALGSLWFGTVGELPTTYLRTRKWSGLFLSISAVRLALNVTLNVCFLAIWHMGVAGVLIGNMIAGGASCITLCLILWWTRGGYAVQGGLLLKLLRYGSPLIATALLSFLMHQADRWLLRLSNVPMSDVGVYSLAYQVGQGVNTFFVVPFISIWSVMIFEIAQQPEAREVYVKVFRYFVCTLSLVMLGVSLFAWPLVRILFAADYGEAADLIPIVCLAYLFFSLHTHFAVPALLAKQTALLLPASIVGAAFNVEANLVFIPYWGKTAAAWVTVVTFALFSFVGLWCYRKIDRYQYPFWTCGAILAGMILTFVGWNMLADWHSQPIRSFVLASLLWLGWLGVLFGSQWRNAKTLLGQMTARKLSTGPVSRPEPVACSEALFEAPVESVS